MRQTLKTTNGSKENCVSLRAQIIQSNLIFGLTIHPDSNVLTIFLYAMQIASVTTLLYFILRSALFDSSFLPASAINCILDSPCEVLHV